jgi:hypothetical protein
LATRRIYKIIFHNQGEIFEVYAQSVSHGSMFGFVEVEGLLFGERSQVVVDPAEERLKTEFKGVQRVFVPMHSVVRIDEVEKEGVSRITKQEETSDGNVSSFPGPIYAPGPTPGDSGQS